MLSTTKNVQIEKEILDFACQKKLWICIDNAGAESVWSFYTTDLNLNL